MFREPYFWGCYSFIPSSSFSVFSKDFIKTNVLESGVLFWGQDKKGSMRPTGLHEGNL